MEEQNNLQKPESMTNKEFKSKGLPDKEEKIPHRFSLPLGVEEHWCLVLMNILIIVPFIGWIAPIVFWFDSKDISAKINKQGRYILNWYISGFLYLVTFIICLQVNMKANMSNIIEYSIATKRENVLPMYFEKFFENPVIAIGGVLYLIAGILFMLSILFPIIGAIKGYNRHTWKYPLSIPFLK